MAVVVAMWWWLCPPARTGTQKSQSSGPYSCPFSQRYGQVISAPLLLWEKDTKLGKFHKSDELGEEEEVETEK